MDENQDDICAYMRNEFDYPAYRISMSGMFSVAALVTTVLNSLVLISIWKTPSLHKPSYILIGSLALSDLLVGAIGEPMMIGYHLADLRRWSLNNFCLIFKYAKIVNFNLGFISLLTLMLISFDRLLAVKLRNKYQSVVTKKRVLLSLAECWIISSVVSIALPGNFDLNPENVRAILLFLGISVMILVVIITVFYSMAFFTLRKITSYSVSPSVQNAEAVPPPGSSIDLIKYRRSLITMFVVFVATILFYVPVFSIFIASFVFRHKHHYSQMPAYDIILMCEGAAEYFILLNSAMNPLLYLWRIRDIRQTVKIAIKKVF